MGCPLSVGNRKSISAHKTQNSQESNTGRSTGGGRERGGRHTNISFIYSFILLMTRKAKAKAKAKQNQCAREGVREKEVRWEGAGASAA